MLNVSCPQQLRRVRAYCGLHDFAPALANANALVQVNPSPTNFCLRADVREKMHDKAGTAQDLMLAITASEQEGEDAMNEVDRLEALTGKKVQRPIVDPTKSESIFRELVTTAKSEQRYDSSFIEKQLGLHLYEIPIKNKPDIHTSEFCLRDRSKNFSEIK